MADEPQSSSNPKKLDDQKRRSNDAERTASEDLNWVLADPRGRRFMRGVMAFCGEHTSSFHTNAAVMGNNEGKRLVGLWLKSRMLALKPSDATLIAVLLSGEEKK